MINVQPLVDRVIETVSRHALGNGAYARYLWQDKEGGRNLAADPYGCADAANILYTVGALPTGEEALAMVRAMQGLQDPESGLFQSMDAHHPIHTTAHVVAALELFDAKPLYPLRALEEYFTIPGMIGLLETMAPAENPWSISHQGAGIYAAGVITGSVTPEWENAYFDWFWKNADPITGISLKGALDRSKVTEHGYHRYLYGWFHYLFNHEYAHRPFPHVEKTLNSLAVMQRWNLFGADFGKYCDFRPIDVVYVSSRCMRKTPHRFAENMAFLDKFADEYLENLFALDPEKDDSMNDLHRLFGALCAVAELQSVLPGKLYTKKPLRLVLDRRPFI